MADIQFEHIDPYVEGLGGDTGFTSRQKLRRNFEKIKSWMDGVATALASWFLRKDQPDTAQETITFQKGAKFGTYTTGPLGTGGAVVIDQSGNSSAEFDYITIRKAATFRELTIKELRHVGGEIVLSAAAMKCSKVVPLDPNMQPIAADSPMIACYKCFFDTNDADGNQQVFQEFVKGDLARCQTFGSSVGESSGYTSTRYYWREVLVVGEDYIILGNGSGDKDDDCTSAPAVGDNIVQLGYVGDDKPYRQSAIILSATDTDAPSMKSYQGINSFTLPSPVKDEGYDTSTGVFHTKTYGESYVGMSDQSTYMKFTPANGVEIKGKVEMSKTSTLDGVRLATSIANAQSAADNAQEAADAAQTAADDAQTAADAADARIDGLSSGAENLLRNSGFTGDYTSESVTSGTGVNAGTQMYSDAFDHWTKTNATAGTNASSASGVAVTLSNGSLTQTLERTIAAGTKCIFSFKGSGTTLTFSLGGYSKTITLGNSVQLFQEAFVTSSASSTFSITAATGVIMELMLIEGTIPNGNWVNSPKDNDKTLAYFQALSFLTDAIENNNTEILGGLILTQLIKVGYMQNSVRQITGGMNGIANNDDSPFLWGGGTLEQAMETITAYANNPTHQTTQAELQSLAKFVVTHGGRAILNDVILRGLVYATGGKFTGKDGMFRIELDAENRKISVYGPSVVVGPTDFTPASGATEVEYLTIGEFMVTGGSGQSYRICPTIKFHFPSAVGSTDVLLDPFNGLRITSTANGVTTTSIFTHNSISLDNSLIYLDNLPTNSADCAVGQVYRDGSTLKIKTS